MILGASFDEPAANAAFVKKHDFPFAILCDVKKELAIAYGAAADAKAAFPARVSFLIGADGRIERVFERVDPTTHAAAVLEALARLESRPQ